MKLAAVPETESGPPGLSSRIATGGGSSFGSVTLTLSSGTLIHPPLPSAASHTCLDRSGVWQCLSSSCSQPRDLPRLASDWAFHALSPLKESQRLGRPVWRQTGLPLTIRPCTSAYSPRQPFASESIFGLSIISAAGAGKSSRLATAHCSSACLTHSPPSQASHTTLDCDG